MIERQSGDIHASVPPDTLFLRIETGMHTVMINCIDVDAAEHYLVTASDDKTARVWDLANGKLLQVLRPPLGPGDEGKLFAVAIAPDGKMVAVGVGPAMNGTDRAPSIFSTGTAAGWSGGSPTCRILLSTSPILRTGAIWRRH